MKLCNQIRARISFYLDDELRGHDLRSFQAHVASCSDCQEAVASERRFLKSVRSSRPLSKASAGLRSRVEALLQNDSSYYKASGRLRRRVRDSINRVLQRSPSTPSRPNRKLLWVVTAVVALAAAGLWVELGRRPDWQSHTPSDFTMAAVDAHKRRLSGKLALEVQSTSPEVISNWFAGRVPFSLKLPNYQAISGQDQLYQLQGARSITFHNEGAAYVAYWMQMRPISLLVTSNRMVTPSGGEEVSSRGLVFHCQSIGGLKVITWADRGLTYALVSDLEQRGQKSCMVCHSGTRDRDFIENLRL